MTEPTHTEALTESRHRGDLRPPDPWWQGLAGAVCFVVGVALVVGAMLLFGAADVVANWIGVVGFGAWVWAALSGGEP